MTQPLSGSPVTYVYVTNRENALAFYRDTLGLALRSSDDAGDLIDLGGGGLLHITPMASHTPGDHPVLGWHVADVTASVQALAAKGVVFNIFEGFGQDALGIWTSPDGQTKLAFFADPDGNALTLSQG